MIRCDFIPYEGDGKYIFVSYAHKDGGIVFPVIEELHRRGYRIWYDDGIAPGSEWPEDIANHLNGCALVMAFITPNSLASDNCRREITYSLAKKKAFLGVIMEPVEMTPGIEMQLSAQQCVVKFSYRDEESFLRKLCSCQHMDDCREKQIAEALPEPAAKAPAPKVEKPKDISASKATQRSTGKQKSAKAVNKKTWLIAGGIALGVLAIVLVAVFFMLPGSQTESNSAKINWVTIGDESYAVEHDTMLYLSGDTVSKEDIAKINQLTKLENVTFSSCDFEKGALEELVLPETVDYLFFTGCTGLDNLQFLDAMTNLRTLILTECEITDALLPSLSMENLSTLKLDGNQGLTDLSKVSGCGKLKILDISETGVTNLDAFENHSLKELYFSDTKIKDISFLANMTSLQHVMGADSAVRSIDALATLEELQVINFNGCKLEAPTEEFCCLRLKELHLANTGIDSLEAFANLTILTVLDISGNGLYDISPIAKNAKTLQTINLSGNTLVAADIEFLTEASLMEAHFDGIYMEDLRVLKNSQDLVRLYAVDCGIRDISALTGFEKLIQVRLAKNEITDISPLKDITGNYLRIDLSFNPIQDVSSLPKQEYTLLGLLCEELDPTTFPEIAGNKLLLFYTEDVAETIILQQKFTYVVLDCPADKRVALEDTVGSWRLHLPRSMEALVELLKESEIDVSYLLEG